VRTAGFLGMLHMLLCHVHSSQCQGCSTEALPPMPRQGWPLLRAQPLQLREHGRAGAQEQVRQGPVKLGARVRWDHPAHCQQGVILKCAF
jgi:hypothetical protein